jgi:hypothetical protein
VPKVNISVVLHRFLETSLHSFCAHKNIEVIKLHLNSRASRRETNYFTRSWNWRGRDSAVGIATGYWLDGPGIESRLGAIFSAPFQTGPAAHPAFCTMRSGSFLGVKSGWGVTLTPHPLLVPWSRNRRSIPLLFLWAIRPVQILSVQGWTLRYLSWNWQKVMALNAIECLCVCTFSPRHVALWLQCVVTFILYPD